jgi:hypothetical protein
MNSVEAISVTERDINTTSPNYLHNVMEKEYEFDQQIYENNVFEEEDVEDITWKNAQKKVIIPQDYVDAEFLKRLRLLAKCFAAITAEAKRISSCDFCKEIMDTPQITRACCHSLCFKCLKSEDDDNQEDGKQNGKEDEEEKEEQTKNSVIKSYNKTILNGRASVGLNVVCPVCKTKTEARRDLALVQFLQKINVFTLSSTKASRT